MSIKANFNFNDILKNHQTFLDNVSVSLLEAMDQTANTIADLAKNTNTYTDRTNNLRSSIGFVLYKDGQKVGASFAKTGKGDEGNGAAGASRGESVAESVAAKYASGYVVVLVAGMDYAAYVEAKGFDVITGATMQFEDELARNLQSISRVTGINFSKAE